MDQVVREHLKRYNTLLEYDFYATEDMDLDAEKEVQRILGEDDPEAEVDPENEEEDNEMKAPESEAELGGDTGEEMDDGTGEEELGGIEGEEDPMPEGEDEDVEEIDVTELVRYAEEAKDTAEQGNEKVEKLFSKFEELENQLNQMDQISKKIEDLENEVEKRNPTDEEQLEMRSFDSYPYNLKLTDYWSEKTGYQATEDEDEMYDEEQGEYVLTTSDVENDYSEEAVKRSLEKDQAGHDNFPSFNL